MTERPAHHHQTERDCAGPPRHLHRPVEPVAVEVHLDPYLSLKALAGYSSLSRNTLRQYLELPPEQALPCYRLGGKILVRRSVFDTWMQQYAARGRPGLVQAIRAVGLDAGETS